MCHMTSMSKMKNCLHSIIIQNLVPNTLNIKDKSLMISQALMYTVYGHRFLMEIKLLSKGDRSWCLVDCNIGIPLPLSEREREDCG